MNHKNHTWELSMKDCEECGGALYYCSHHQCKKYLHSEDYCFSLDYPRRRTNRIITDEETAIPRASGERKR